MPKSVVIVGGGVGGLFTANKLTSKLASEVRRGEVSITLVEPQEKQVYQPGFARSRSHWWSLRKNKFISRGSSTSRSRIYLPT